LPQANRENTFTDATGQNDHGYESCTDRRPGSRRPACRIRSPAAGLEARDRGGHRRRPASRRLVAVARTGRYGRPCHPRAAAEIVYATGAVEPETWSRSTPLVRGRIIERCRCEGKIVRKGDLLARLDDKEALATLNDLRALEEFQKREFDRQSQLLARGWRLRRPISAPRATLRRIQAQIAAQAQRLEYYKLVSPMDGTVLKEDGEVGDMVDPAPSSTASASKDRYGSSPTSTRKTFPRPGRPEGAAAHRCLCRSGAARLRQADHAAGDPVSKTFRVRIGLPDDTPLRVGMSVEANIVSREKADVLLVPPMPWSTATY